MFKKNLISTKISKNHPSVQKEAVFRCVICKKAYNHPSNLKRHVRTAHFEASDGKLFTCDTCSKSFKDPSALRQHKFLHLQVRKFQCSYCSKSFAVRSQLETHNLVHNGSRPFSCEMCEMRFRTKGHLKSHQLHRHLGFSQEKKKRCTMCEKQFVTLHDLRVHLRWHSGERPFPCPQCSKAFRSERHLESHIRLHTGEKPYSCNNCNKTFASCSALYQHFKIYSGCQLKSQPGAYSKHRERWKINDKESLMRAATAGTSLEAGPVNETDFAASELKEVETVVYLAADSELALVDGGIIEKDIQSIGLEVNIQEKGETLSLVEIPHPNHL